MPDTVIQKKIVIGSSSKTGPFLENYDFKLMQAKRKIFFLFLLKSIKKIRICKPEVTFSTRKYPVKQGQPS